MNSQIGLFNEYLRPGSSNQLLLADYFTGALDQKDKNIEGAAAKPHLLVALKQKPLLCEEREWTKRDRAPLHGTETSGSSDPFYSIFLERPYGSFGTQGRAKIDYFRNGSRLCENSKVR